MRIYTITFFTLGILGFIFFFIGLFYVGKYSELLKLTKDFEKLKNCLTKALIYSFILPLICFTITSKFFNLLLIQEKDNVVTEYIAPVLNKTDYFIIILGIILTICLLIYPTIKFSSIYRKLGIIYNIGQFVFFNVLIFIFNINFIITVIIVNKINLIFIVFLRHSPIIIKKRK
jgi:hypothetical protein